MFKSIIITLLIFLILAITFYGADYANTLSVSNFLTYYYLHPDSEKVPKILRKYLYAAHFNRLSQSFSGALTAYMFGRIAALNPHLLTDYVLAYDKAKKLGKVFLFNVFLVYHDNYVREHLLTCNEQDEQLSKAIQIVLKQPPLYRTPFLREKPSDATHFDFLWAEFFVTGEKRPVQQIMDFLNEEEIFPVKLFKWLDKNPSPSEIFEIKRILEAKMSTQFDEVAGALDYPGDLDACFFTLVSRESKNADVVKLKQCLGLSPAEWIYLGNKGTAAWSLRANAKQHQAVKEFCKEEALKRQDKSAFEIAMAYNLASKPNEKIYTSFVLSRRNTASGISNKQ